METLLLTCRYQSVDPCSFSVAYVLCSQADFNSTLSIHRMNEEIWLGSYMTPTVLHLQITSYISVGTSTILHKWPSSHMSCTPQQHLQPAPGPFLTQQSESHYSWQSASLSVLVSSLLGLTTKQCVWDDDYGNPVMGRVCAHTCESDRTVGISIFKNNSLCLCVQYIFEFKHAYIHTVLRILK